MRGRSPGAMPAPDDHHDADLRAITGARLEHDGGQVGRAGRRRARHDRLARVGQQVDQGRAQPFGVGVDRDAARWQRVARPAAVRRRPSRPAPRLRRWHRDRRARSRSGCRLREVEDVVHEPVEARDFFVDVGNRRRCGVDRRHAAAQRTQRRLDDQSGGCGFRARSPSTGTRATRAVRAAWPRAGSGRWPSSST